MRTSSLRTVLTTAPICGGGTALIWGFREEGPVGHSECVCRADGSASGRATPVVGCVGMRATPRSLGRVSPLTSLHPSPLICKPVLITAPHRAGVRITFYNACKVLGQRLGPNKWPALVRYHYL